MRSLLLFAVLGLLVAFSLVLNLALPNNGRLVFVPLISGVLIVVIVGRAFRRPN